MHLVGKIKYSIYKCITEDILTDNQMQHILDRHPDTYREVIRGGKIRCNHTP